MKKIRRSNFLSLFKQLLALILLSICYVNCQKEQEPDLKILDSLSLELIGELPSQINECSGFFVEQEVLHIINDGGGGAKLHTLNPDNLIEIDSFMFTVIENKDWEAIIATETEIIIGDFGNNFGTRQDLTIYHLDKQTKSLTTKVIFNYPNQKSFEPSNTHNFDCEAFLMLDNQYFLFSKNRGNSYTDIYQAPVYTNEFVLVDSIKVPSLITDVAYYKEKEWILLLGNELVGGNFKSHLSILAFNEENQLDLLTTLKIEESEQFEAITQKNGPIFYLGSEKERTKGGNLYELTLN